MAQLNGDVLVAGAKLQEHISEKLFSHKKLLELRSSRVSSTAALVEVKTSSLCWTPHFCTQSWALLLLG